MKKELIIVCLVTFLLVFAGCSEKQGKIIDKPKQEVKTEPVKETAPIVEEEKEPEIEYNLYNEIEGLSYMDANEHVFINLIDTKTDELKIDDYTLDDGTQMAHMINYKISSDNELEIYIVENAEEYEKFRKGQAFEKYEDCTGTEGECFVSFYSGMIIVNKEDNRAKIERSIKIYEPELVS
jgi:hypothetical protein